ncbi:DMT family transporter [Pseudonocardia acaciae]|uniref:DMT family transporter n=1 Tax=Pseudonocardia acaciae TaxID=551276 RepID=UPI0007E8D4D9|nr:DMT family transporter [Pseudonocardia acaciae]
MSRWTDGLAFGAAGVLCFSGTAPATRVAAGVFGADVLTYGRIVIAAVLGLATLLVTGRLGWPGRELVPSLLVTGVGLAVGFPLFLALAVERVPAYHGAVVIGLAPAATAVLSALRTGERPPARFWLACAVGFAAVVAFALVQGGGGPSAADGWLVASILSVAVGYVEGGRVARRLGGTRTLCWAMILLAPAAAVLLAVAASTRTFGAIPARAWVGFGYAGVASMFVGSVLWYLGLAAGGTARVGQLNLAQPFLAIAWSALLLGERITWSVPVTAAVVLGCMGVCLNAPRSRAPASYPLR